MNKCLEIIIFVVSKCCVHHIASTGHSLFKSARVFYTNNIRHLAMEKHDGQELVSTMTMLTNDLLHHLPYILFLEMYTLSIHAHTPPAL